MPRARGPKHWVHWCKTYLLHCRHHGYDGKDQKGRPHAESRGASTGGLAGIRINVRHGCLEGVVLFYGSCGAIINSHQPCPCAPSNPLAVGRIFGVYSPQASMCSSSVGLFSILYGSTGLPFEWSQVAYVPVHGSEITGTVAVMSTKKFIERKDEL